jgi:hypothetical protein
MNTPLTAAGTYVQITRQEFEDWLDSLGFRGKWRLKPGRGGMYQLFLSHQVMIEINSTTGSQAQVMQRGRASMSLKLVSRITGRVLNKKAMGQRHFARTTNWRKNWAKGVERMKAAYEGSKGWYDQIAEIEDRDKYKAEMMERIEAIPDWDGDAFLTSLHERLGTGGVLSSKQKAALERTEGRQHPREPAREPAPPSRPPRERPEPPTRSRVQEPEPEPPAEPAWELPDIETVRELYRRARAANDTWTLGFAESVGKRIKGGRPLTERQQKMLDEKLEDYRLGPNSRRAHIVEW